MASKTTSREWGLAIAAVVLLVAAGVGPHIGAPANYHHFVDQRSWGGLPHAGDVLSNIGFLIAGVAGACCLWRLPPRSLTNMERAMAALFFAGLIATSACSTWYHLQPDEARLVIDRSGMAIAFAGLLGLAVTTRVSERAGALTGLGLLLAAPWTIHIAASGELLPWAVLQFGGMAALCVLARVRPLPLALHVDWIVIVAIYGVAKVAEVGDAAIFEFTGHLVSGHTLKHLIAAFAAWPLVAALDARRSVQNGKRHAGWRAPLRIGL
jgi:hypothetical protein